MLDILVKLLNKSDKFMDSVHEKATLIYQKACVDFDLGPGVKLYLSKASGD